MSVEKLYKDANHQHVAASIGYACDPNSSYDGYYFIAPNKEAAETSTIMTLGEFAEWALNNPFVSDHSVVAKARNYIFAASGFCVNPASSSNDNAVLTFNFQTSSTDDITYACAFTIYGGTDSSKYEALSDRILLEYLDAFSDGEATASETQKLILDYIEPAAQLIPYIRIVVGSKLLTEGIMTRSEYNTYIAPYETGAIVAESV